jgi:hypothetical protein
VEAIAIDSSTPGTIYAATSTMGVFKSTDGGDSWHAVGTGLNEADVTGMAIDPDMPGSLYAATTTGVFKIQQSETTATPTSTATPSSTLAFSPTATSSATLTFTPTATPSISASTARPHGNGGGCSLVASNHVEPSALLLLLVPLGLRWMWSRRARSFVHPQRSGHPRPSAPRSHR